MQINQETTNVANNKLTRKQYSRKRLFVAVMVFVAIALIVSGIAIWLLFTALNGGFGADINVGAVAASPMAFESLFIDGEEADSDGTSRVRNGFIMDCVEGDEDGRVTWNGTDYEKMTVNIQGVISNAQHLASFSYVLKLPEGVISAAEKGYLDVSDYYDFETEEFRTIELDLAKDGDMITLNGKTVWRFNFDIKLKWGEKFAGINPSIYYDTIDLTTPTEEVAKILNDLRYTVYNGNLLVTPQFTLTMTASPNQ